MEILGVYNTDNRPGTVPDSSTAPLSAKQLRDEVINAIANLKSKGIPEWQILNAWSELAQEQGNYAAADTLASAAFELGKPALVNALILTRYEETRMGYTTKFDGIFTLDQPLFDSQGFYLLEFAGTRRVGRNTALLENVPPSQNCC